MRKATDFLPRRAAELITEVFSDTRVVVVNGARQVGKSTLAEVVLRHGDNGVARFLDDPVTRAAAVADPVRFVRHDGLMLIDEVQRVPDLWLAIKHVVDRDSRPGRSETIELWPLSQGEIDGAPDGFVAAAFELGAGVRAAATEELQRKDYVARTARGGYPEARRCVSSLRRQRFFEGYLADLLSRDVKQVADIEKAGDMRRLVALLAAQTGGLLNVNRLAGELSITAPTVRSYIEILQTVYLIRLVPAWSANVTARAIAPPKVIFVDPGLAGHLTAGSVTDASLGGRLENFVLGELARQLTWSRTPAHLYHYRDRDQYEVDGVLEDNAGQIVGVEVKAAETVRADDFRGLKRLQRRLGPRFRAGFVLYCGAESRSFGDGLTCLPISALWTTGG